MQSLLNRHFGKTGAIPADLMDLYHRLFTARGAADYEAFVRFGEAKVRPLLDEARRFVDAIVGMIRSADQEPAPD